MHALTNQRGFTFIELVMFIVIVGIAVAAITLLFRQNVQHSADPLIRQKTIAVAKAYFDEIARKRWDELTPLGGGCIDTTASSNCDPKWQANTWYEVGDRAQPSVFNTHLYEVTVAGKSDVSTEPTWPTGGGTITDGSVVWRDLGSPAIGADGAELRWQYDDVDDYNGVDDSPPQYPDSTDLTDGQSPMPGYSGFRVQISVSKPSSNWEGINATDVKMVRLNVTASTGESMLFTLYRVNY